MPFTAQIENIEKVLHLFIDNNTDFGDPSEVDPIFVAMIRAYQKDIQKDITTKNSYIGEMILTEYTENKTYSPIEHIDTRMGLEKISSHLTGIMLQNFASLDAGEKKDLRDYLQYLFLEVMNNVVDHSHSDVGGYTMAQYFPSGKKIQFVVADRGIGFLENIQLNFNIETEEDAIMEALKKGVTSTTQTMYGAERNAGYGLYAMFEILKLTGGQFVIISNDTLIRYKDGGFTKKELLYPWRGVVVAFEFFESEINYDMDYFKRVYLWADELEEEDEDFF